MPYKYHYLPQLCERSLFCLLSQHQILIAPLYNLRKSQASIHYDWLLQIKHPVQSRSFSNKTLFFFSHLKYVEYYFFFFFPENQPYQPVDSFRQRLGYRHGIRVCRIRHALINLGSLQRLTEQDFQNDFDVNAKGAALAVKTLLPGLKKGLHCVRWWVLFGLPLGLALFAGFGAFFELFVFGGVAGWVFRYLLPAALIGGGAYLLWRQRERA